MPVGEYYSYFVGATKCAELFLNKVSVYHRSISKRLIFTRQMSSTLSYIYAKYNFPKCLLILQLHLYLYITDTCVNREQMSPIEPLWCHQHRYHKDPLQHLLYISAASVLANNKTKHFFYFAAAQRVKRMWASPRWLPQRSNNNGCDPKSSVMIGGSGVLNQAAARPYRHEFQYQAAHHILIPIT